VERMFGTLKHFRRVATRYDKTALSFLSFVQLAASYLWLKQVSRDPRSLHQLRRQKGNYLNQRISDLTISLLSFPRRVKAHLFVSWLHPYKEKKLIVVGN